MSRRVLVIVGPTASGKTALSLELARHLPIEIISADARQVYKHLDIGTAKPTAAERGVCRHHCIDILEPSAPYSAADYARDARAAINEVPSTHLPVIVGGSGLYIQAALDGFSTDAIAPEPDVRERLQSELDQRGREAMYAELQRKDARSAERYADMNPRRILRALEYIEITGRPFSETWDQHRDAFDVDAVYIGIEIDRELLNTRINARCDAMWRDGLLNETQRVLDMGVSPSAQSLQTVGYVEAIAVLNGTMNLPDAQEKLRVSTRRYAKRQRTWFQRDDRIHWISVNTESTQPSTLSTLRLLLGDFVV